MVEVRSVLAGRTRSVCSNKKPLFRLLKFLSKVSAVREGELPQGWTSMGQTFGYVLPGLGNTEVGSEDGEGDWQGPRENCSALP